MSNMRLLGTFHESSDQFRNRTLGTDRPPAGRPRVLPSFWQNEAKFANEISPGAIAGDLPWRHQNLRFPTSVMSLKSTIWTPCVTRLKSNGSKLGIEAEEIKELAVNVLRKAVASRDVSNNMLLRIIVSLSKSTEGVLKELEQQAGKQRRRKRAGARHSAKQPPPR